jgi:Uma2 family endonuclease
MQCFALPSFSTATDFLAWEDRQEGRYEFAEGVVVAKAWADDRHVTVVGNVAMALHQHCAASPCQTYASAMRLRVDAIDSYFYPDVMVTCSPRDHASARLKSDPILVVEVLSPSTAGYDMGIKFAHYRRINSLQECAWINVDSRTVNCHRKGTDGLWVLHPFAKGETVTLASVGLEITAAKLFDEV